MLLLLASMAAGSWPALVSVSLVFVAGGILFFHVSRRLGTDSRLMYLVCGSYVLRSALATGFFVVSAHRLPLVENLQLGHGFWTFAPDAVDYHGLALTLLREGLCAGWIRAGAALDLFSGVVAWFYWWFVPHPLLAVVFNVWAATGTAVLAFAIGRDVGRSDAAGLGAAAFVALWPSTLIWSSQLLREPVFLFLLFLVFYLTARLVSLQGRRRVAAAAILAGMAGAVFLLSKSRPYSGLVLLGGAAAAGLITLVVGRTRALAVCCVTVIGVSLWWGVTRPVWLPLTPVFAGAGGAVGAVDCDGRPTRRWAARGPLLPAPSIETLDQARHGYVRSGGNATGDVRADISTPRGLVGRVPATVAAAIGAPYPWRWFPGSTTGLFRSLAGIEVGLLTLLVPVLVVGSLQVGVRRSFLGVFMLTYGLMIWFLVALVVVNEGTLFRLRLQGVLPVLVVAISGGGLRVYERLWKRTSSFARSLKGTP